MADPGELGDRRPDHAPVLAGPVPQDLLPVRLGPREQEGPGARDDAAEHNAVQRAGAHGGAPRIGAPVEAQDVDAGDDEHDDRQVARAQVAQENGPRPVDADARHRTGSRWMSHSTSQVSVHHAAGDG